MSEPIYDLIVLGGGITGAGVARDAALRGLAVALFEKGDYASGTSSKSSKLVHGGLRYLQHGELGLVFESVSERLLQTKMAPHLVRPLPFLVPIYADTKPGLELMNIGLWIYDSLALFRAPRMHRTHRGAKRALTLEPLLGGEGMQGVIEYYDCATDDARLTLENILDAEALGAHCHNYASVIKFLRQPSGRVTGVVVHDHTTGRERHVLARAVIVAAGAWTDEVAQRLGIPFGRNLLRRTKGVHIVVPRHKLPLARAITLISSIDGRVMFAIPWNERIVLGTTDTDFAGDPDHVHAEAADIEYLCKSANAYFPTADISPSDVISTWAGLRPLIAQAETASASAVSREHEIFVRDEGIVLVAGGKLTTYRRMAKQVVDAAVKWLRSHDPAMKGRTIDMVKTKHRPLPGGQGLEEPTLDAVAAIGHELTRTHKLDTDTATHLCGVYGARAALVADLITAQPQLGVRLNPDLPYVWAEVAFAIAHEHAKTVEDVLARRMPLMLVGLAQGLDVAPRVADMLGTVLSWSAEVKAAQLAAYEQVVAESRRFRG
ncbi:MAG: glycerol-3-phosphate dehydrogenase [Myxococcales bacterium]|nr:glycerol-3-phosphate dehydrogenase [Myxococcales bacterium]